MFFDLPQMRNCLKDERIVKNCDFEVPDNFIKKSITQKKYC